MVVNCSIIHWVADASQQSCFFLLGYIISTSNFVDHFREELYWLSVNGQLQGILPCLGMGPRSFFSVTLPLGCKGGSNIKDGKDEHAHFLYFNDGQGAITCVHLG